MTSAVPKAMTLAEFLDWEERQVDRYEFAHGEIVAMTGGTLGHNELVRHAAARLQSAMGGRRCSVFAETAKVTVKDASLYPDVVVTCSAVERTWTVVPDPVLIVEVLSPSTAGRDMGSKWLRYQEIPSLAHYLILHQSGVTARLYSREGEGWRYRVLASAADPLDLPEIGVSLRLGSLYPKDWVPEADLFEG